MEAVALNKVIALFIIYFIAGLIPIIGITASKKISRYDCLVWGALLIYLAAFMLVPLAEVRALVEVYIEKGCEYDVVTRSCERVLTAANYADLKIFNQYVLLLTFLFTLTIGGTGVNMFSQGVAGRGTFINVDTERKFRDWLIRIEKTQRKQFYLLVISLAISIVSLFTVSLVVAFVS
jgi:hypothetical protein